MSFVLRPIKTVVVVGIISMTLYWLLFNHNTIPKIRWMGFELDKSQLLLQKDSFNMINNWGEKIGSMVIQGSMDSTNYIWKDESVLDGVISERAIYQFNDGLQLQKSTVDFQQGNSRITGRLNWQDDHVNGTYEIIEGVKSRTVQVDTTVIGLVNRAEIFALIQTLPLKVGSRFPIKALVQPNGEIWKMNLQVQGMEKCIVPAGEFETFKIGLTGEKLSNVLYVTNGNKRKLVKVEVVNQPITIELVYFMN